MPRRYVFWTVAALAVVAAVVQAWSLRFTCDDAYISFRYAQHFADGHGLVFNLDPNEAPVEGYTNFSWTMWLALGAMLGFAHDGLEIWSILWGVVCHGGTVLLLAAMADRASSGRALVPIAACAYAAIHHASSLAPAGLETALFVLLATALMRFALALRCQREAWLMGFLGVLCAMTRPDGGLFVAMGGLFVLFDAVQRRAPRLLIGYVAPFVLVFVPYLLWRHSYYGAWVPNTAVAKSAGDPLFGLGWDYVSGFFACYYALLPAIVPIVWFLLKKPDLLATISPFLGRRPWFVIVAFALPYIAFVTWVGGDFMFSRFLLPVLPMLLFAWDVACQRWRPLWLQPTLAAALVLGLCLRNEPEGLNDHLRAVSDNRAISFKQMAGITFLDAFRSSGEYLHQLFDGLDVRIAIAGAHANLAFRSRVPVAIECAAGLTDAHIARLHIKKRVKVGHGKPPDLAYLERRGVQFHLEDFLTAQDPWRVLRFPSVPLPTPGSMVTWDRELMRELLRRDPNIQVVDFEPFLDAYIADLPSKQKPDVRRDLQKFRRYYFDHNSDPERLAKIEAFLR